MLPLFKVFMSPDVCQPVTDVLMSGFVTQGPQVEKYEAALKSFFDNPCILSLNSATAGLTLALKLLKTPDPITQWPGFDPNTDTVLTPALTCFATTAAILANHVDIRWLDIDPNTANIDLNDLKAKLTANTKVIYLVHWGGTPVDLDTLDQICEEHKVKHGFKPAVVEDCAHAFGAEWDGKKLGSRHHKNICVFSTQAIKHLTTGDGGIITLPTSQLYERCKLLRWYGIDREKRNYEGKDLRLENDIEEWGYKFHMNDINATIGLHNLPHISSLLEKNRANARLLDEALSTVPGIEIVRPPPNANSAYWLYTIRVLNGKKQRFMDHMKTNNIMTSQVHNRNDVNSCVNKYRETLPLLDELEKELVCIPVGWWLSSSDLKGIIGVVRNEANVDWRSIWNNRSYDDRRLYEHNGYQFDSDHQYQRFAEQLSKCIDVRSGSKILDLGCGNGSLMDAMLKARGVEECDVHGLDFSSRSIEYARENYAGTFSVADMTVKLPYDDDTFDAVCCISSLFYLPDMETVVGVMDEASRVVKPGGVIYLGNCMDADKKDLAEKQRASTHTKQSNHLFINKKDIMRHFCRDEVSIIDNTQLDVEFYAGRDYKFSAVIKTAAVRNIGVDFHDTLSCYPDFFRKLLAEHNGKRVIITGTPRSKGKEVSDALTRLGFHAGIHYDQVEYGYEYNKEDMDFTHFERMKEHKHRAVARHSIAIYYDDNPFYVDYLKDVCEVVFQPILSTEYIDRYKKIDKYFCCNLQEHQFDHLRGLKKKESVYLPGAFDLFHYGHLELVNKVKKTFECRLIVGVQDDALHATVLIIGPEFGNCEEHVRTLRYCEENDIRVEVIERAQGISTTCIKTRLLSCT